MMRLIGGALALFLGYCSIALAQSAPPPDGCKQAAAPTQAATPPTNGPNSGTAPGNAGSTGWTGGTGGSNIGTSQDGPTSTKDGHPGGHPETATGVDPTKPDAGKPKC